MNQLHFFRNVVALLAFTATLAAFAPRASADEFVLVEDGADAAPIVVFEDAPRFTRLAAEELADYIEKISGARPEVIEGEPSESPDRAIWVGYQPVLDSLFPELSFEFEHAEEILIAANENHLVVAGRDVWDPGNMVRQLSRGRQVEGVQREYGTVNAVYTFLQDYLDVRWLWPGKTGEDIIAQETISFEPFEYRYHPQIRARRGLFTRYRLARHGFNPSYEPQNWVRYQRLLFDSLEAPGGHAYNTWWERFHEDHPEYFALQPDGTRSESYRGDKKNVKLCHSNPDVWQQWLEDVEQQIEADPSQTVFNASPGDGYTSGHCICENCRAWDHPGAEQYVFTWAGLSQKYVSLSDRHVKYANKIGRLLKERYPDRDYYVAMLAYGNWRSAPVEAVPDDNVIIIGVFNFHNRPFDQAREQMREWSEVAPNLVWRPNLGFGIWERGLPRVAMDRAIGDMKFAAENNVVGLMFDTVWGHWATHGPHYYMLGKMAWNPDADGEAILQDYYQRGFGKAASDLEAYWTLMEDATRDIVFNDVNWRERFDDAFFSEAYGHLDSAMQNLEGEPAKYRERIDFVKTGLDYTRHYTRIHDLMMRYHESEGADTDAAEQARAIWLDEVLPLVADSVAKYPSAFNRLFAGPIAGRSMRNLFPENLRAQWRERVREMR